VVSVADDEQARRVVEALVLIEQDGLWAVRSTSATVYYLDLGVEPRQTRARLLRVPGAASPRGPWDGCWLHLVSVESTEGWGAVRVGRRHRWTMDPGGHDPYIWWIQRTVTAIERLDPIDRPPGRSPAPDEPQRPFERRAARTP